jgi:hypothetical protein
MRLIGRIVADLNYLYKRHLCVIFDGTLMTQIGLIIADKISKIRVISVP